ncbi:hypothetical protein IJG91_03030 [Candidatus Saccharibacteria bacterium]|nr:hypothetical protein [Candidatus Saccharibacteria bacterium]
MPKPRVKNKNDPRYINIQKNIDRVLGRFVKHGHIANLKVSEVTSDADIFISTFYDHHKNLDAAIKHLNEKMKNELSELAKETLEMHCKLEVYYPKLLHFINKNKNYYDISIKTGNVSIIMMAINSARPFVMDKWPGRTSEEKIYKFYILSWRVCTEIWWWGEKYKFGEEKIDKLTQKLLSHTTEIGKTYLKEL